MQLYEGIIKSWKEDKGFGFIRPNIGDKDVFVHVRDLKHNNYRPKVGDCVFYKMVSDSTGKARAYEAFIKGIEIGQQTKKTFKANEFKQNTNQEHLFGKLTIFVIAASPFGLSILLIIQKHNFIPFFIYSLLSLSMFIIYAIDKTKAHKNEWRISEDTLHLFEFLGGWPGALITQRLIRHKNKKAAFQRVFWFIIVLHMTVWVDVMFFDNHLNSLFAIFRQ